ncbi:hypothetical protein CPB84DRAFT_254206 [Gymnopilus junonius]|uniref:Uncharacterized protein n=1 Tax=Gymnopilus junonius TaxID=109634 RepID=A0A9P5THF2_GYMJU|nr:hypothetical protein CPB84DRAFT_254206 [Gymnopilus junonius]
MQSDIKQDIEHNLRNAVNCHFDELLKHFLYLVLKKNSVEKKKLDELQAKIEELQWTRYCVYENDGHGGDKVSDVTLQDRLAEEERASITSRDDMLDGLLRKALYVVQPIANDTEVNKLLSSFAAAFEDTEAVFYSSCVRLCNDFLTGKDLRGNLPLRCSNTLDIRFQHDDCYPAVMVSSRSALLHTHKDSNPDFTNPPPSQILWQATLACNEFDIADERYPEGIMVYLESHVFEKEAGIILFPMRWIIRRRTDWKKIPQILSDANEAAKSQVLGVIRGHRLRVCVSLLSRPQEAKRSRQELSLGRHCREKHEGSSGMPLRMCIIYFRNVFL